MSSLKRFVSKPTISSEFLMSRNPEPDTRFEVEDKIAESKIDLLTIRRVLDEAMEKSPDGGTPLDRHTAIDLHRALPLTRAEAADMNFWWWICICFEPGYVSLRWRNGGSVSPERYLGSRVKNALARLWWVAELTRDEDDYTLTSTVLSLPGFQDINEQIAGRLFGSYRPAVSAFIDVVGRRSEGVVRETAKGFNAVLSTVVLESMTEVDLGRELEWIVDLV